MMKSTLIALAALTAYDAVATGGRYRTEFIYAVMHFVREFVGMGWSMTIT